MKVSLVLAGAMAFAASASAQITTATFTDGTHFDYQFKNLPDLDQRRMSSGSILGLPNNGDAYCVPTSSLNLISYVASHGYPLLPPGPQDWTDPSTYNAATLTLISLGLTMGTNPTKGTKAGGGPAGLGSWMAGYGPFIVCEDYATGNHSPTLTTITEMAMTGPLMDVCVGRYDIIGTFHGLPLVVHDHGHCMTLARTHANGNSDKKLWTRDPGDPNDGLETTQSHYANHQFSITPKTLYVSDTTTNKVTMSVLNFDATDTTLRCIDRYVAVQGIGAIFATIPGAVGPTIDFFSPVALAGLPVNPYSAFPTSGTVLDAAVNPDHFGGTFLASGQLQEVNTVTGAISNLGAFPNATRLLYGRSRELYLLSPNLVLSFNPEDDMPVVKSQQLPDLAQAMCYDDVHDQVVLLSNSFHSFFVASAGLPNAPAVIPVPPNTPMGGNGSITVGATDGRYWFVSDASDSIFGAMVTGGQVSSVETISDPAILHPLGVESDDAGRLFVRTMSKLFILAEGPNGWAIINDPLWNGFPPNPCFHVLRSRTNFDPAKMNGPAYDDLTQAELESWEQGPSIPDCGNDAADSSYGMGKAGTHGVPQLAALDPPFLGAPTTVQMTTALPGATPIVLAGLSPQSLPFDKGTLLVTPTFVVSWPVPVDASGNVSFTVTLPGDVSLCGVTLYEQVMFVDPGAIGFHHSAQTNGLARTLGS